MKNLTLSLLAAGSIFSASAVDVQLVVQSVPNQGIVQGNTYRVYVQMPADHSVHAIFADEQSPINIAAENGFYQHPLGSYQSADIQPAVMELDNALKYDSWVTIGADNAVNNDLWNIGLDFSAFSSGGAITGNNGAWFLIPTNERTSSSNGLVLLMQFTTTGSAQGQLSMQGWDANRVAWQARDLTFSTSNAQVFGCTSPEALNYASGATYDDGSCTFQAEGTVLSVVSEREEKTKIEIFPNPVVNGLINLQFNMALDLSKEPMVIEIYDQGGKLVGAQRLTRDMVVDGNRATIEQDLAAGVYTVSLKTSTFSEAINVVVGK